jgi:hypothetical protein
MATLTETAYQTRKTINWMIIGVIGYIVLRLTWAFLVFLYLLLFPPKPPPPNFAYGKLPPIVFPVQTTIPPGELSYALETIDGKLPEASVSAPVYLMPKRSAQLTSLPSAQEFANKLGLNGPMTQETKSIYRFTDSEDQFRALRFDIINNNFILRYRFEENPNVLSEKNIPTPQQTTLDAQMLLNSYNLLTPDFDKGTTTITYLKYKSNTLVKTTSLSQADAVRIDFFRAPIRTLKVVTPNPEEGPIAIVYSGAGDTKKKILQFAYTNWPIDTENYATYAVKNGDQAWQELISGGGYIAKYPTTGTRVIVRTVYLALYDTYDSQTYLQPIYVFEGDNGFVGYVHAITSEWVEGAVSTQNSQTPNQ